MAWNHEHLVLSRVKKLLKKRKKIIFVVISYTEAFWDDCSILIFEKMKSSHSGHDLLSYPDPLTHCPFHIFLPHHGQANTFIIFCSTNKAVHWIEVLTLHNDPLSESHCSYTQDNYSTLLLERGNYWEWCSSRVRGEEKRGLGQGRCGCIVYGGRRSNKGPRLGQDAWPKRWCRDINAVKTLSHTSAMFKISYGISVCFWKS